MCTVRNTHFDKPHLRTRDSHLTITNELTRLISHRTQSFTLLIIHSHISTINHPPTSTQSQQVHHLIPPKPLYYPLPYNIPNHWNTATIVHASKLRCPFMGAMVSCFTNRSIRVFVIIILECWFHKIEMIKRPPMKQNKGCLVTVCHTHVSFNVFLPLVYVKQHGLSIKPCM